MSSVRLANAFCNLGSVTSIVVLTVALPVPTFAFSIIASLIVASFIVASLIVASPDTFCSP